LQALASEDGIGSKVDKKYVSIVRLEPLLTGEPSVRPVAVTSVILPTVPQEARGGGGGAGKKGASTSSKEKDSETDIVVKVAAKAKATTVEKKVIGSELPRGPEEINQKKDKVAPPKVQKVEAVATDAVKDSVGTSADDDCGAALKKTTSSGAKSAQKAVPSIAVSMTRSTSSEALRAQPPSAPSPERHRASNAADHSSKLPLPPNWEIRSDPTTGRVSS
jgi:hypothetical protein